MKLRISAHARPNGPEISKECDVATPVSVGRGPESLLLLDGNGISREHFVLNCESESIFITDQSTNGTWLNGKRLGVGEQRPLALGDEVAIPGFDIRISWCDGASQVPKPEAAPIVPERHTWARSRPVRGHLSRLLSPIEAVLLGLAIVTLAVAASYWIAM